MSHLLLPDLKLALNDLFDPAPGNKRLALFLGTKTSKIYELSLREKQEAINKLPVQLTGRPLTQRLSETDFRHDGFGAAFWLMTEAYLRLPFLSEERRAQLVKLRERFLSGGLAELQRSYADEAANAIDRLDHLQEFEATLKLFPVADGQTLYDWVLSFLENGKLLDDLMSERSSEEAIKEGDKVNAGRLRSATLKKLTRCRETLADEVEENPNLPRNLDDLIFRYFDTLNEQRTQASRAQQSTPASPEGTTPTDAPPAPTTTPAPAPEATAATPSGPSSPGDPPAST